MCVVAGLILTSLAWIGCANYFNWYADTIGPVAWFGTLFLFAAAGVGAGLLFEKSTRAHYQSAMTANPQLKERMETTLGRRLKFGYVLAGLYVAYRLFGYYLFFVLGFSLSPAAHLQLILSAVVEAVVALVCLLLYWERGEDASTANIKKHLLVYVIFFFVLAVVDGVALLVLKPASAVVQTPATLESALEAFSAEEFSGAAAKGAQALQVKDMVGIASALQKINAHFNQSLTSADLYDMRYTINWGLNEAIAYYQFEADDQSIYALQLTENLATSNIAESYYSFPAGSTSALTGQRYLFVANGFKRGRNFVP